MTSTAVTMHVNAAGAPLLPEHVATTAPERSWVRITVSASGVCNADIATSKAEGGVDLPVFARGRSA
jgi:alcohol dehydrogenase